MMPRSIDGFQRHSQPQPPIGSLARRPMPAAIPQRAIVQPVAAPSIQLQTPAIPQKRMFSPTHPISAKPSLWERFQLPLFILGCTLAGFFVQSVVFGMLAIAAYGIGMLIFRINSRVTFALAFISLVTVVALLLVKQNVELASNFATYTFLLLVLGVIALSLEARPQGRKKRRNGR